MGLPAFCDCVRKELLVLAEGYGIGLDPETYFYSGHFDFLVLIQVVVCQNVVCLSVTLSTVRLPSFGIDVGHF